MVEATDSLDDLGDGALQLAQKVVVILRNRQDCSNHTVNCPVQQRVPTDKGIVCSARAGGFRGLQE